MRPQPRNLCPEPAKIGTHRQGEGCAPLLNRKAHFSPPARSLSRMCCQRKIRDILVCWDSTRAEGFSKEPHKSCWPQPHMETTGQVCQRHLRQTTCGEAGGLRGARLGASPRFPSTDGPGELEQAGAPS